MNPAVAEHWQKGQKFTASKQWSKAAVAYERVTSIDPGFTPGWLELSSALEQTDAYRASRESVFSAARASGPDVEPMLGLTIARRLRRFEEAGLLAGYVAATRLTERLPADKQVDLVMLLSSAGIHAGLRATLERVADARPHDARAHYMLGVLNMFEGRKPAAAEALDRALAIDAAFAPAYSILAQVRKATPGRNRVDELRRRLQACANPQEEFHLAYALHYELHELGDFDAAWSALERACRARRRTHPYDARATAAAFAAQRAVQQRLPNPSRSVADGAGPIFIVGMHRSGTTLLERILAGHDRVVDAGETYAFTAQLRWATDHFCTGVADATLIERFSGVDFGAVGDAYRHAMAWRVQPGQVVTDKLNPNFVLLGQIARALPEARLIHARRSPIDTCFSNLRTMFTIEAAYTYDQVELADYYKAYVDLMAFWRDDLGARVFDVDYERVVSDTEPTVRELAAHCGLDFRASMLDVSREGGMVATASSNDVRTGVLKDRGGAWRPYASHLAPLIDRLAHHGLL